VLLLLKPPLSSLRSHYKVPLWNHQSSEPQRSDARTLEALCLLTLCLPISPQVNSILTSKTVTLWHFFRFDVYVCIKEQYSCFSLFFVSSYFILFGFGLVWFALLW
jgi:hypothetical protein